MKNTKSLRIRNDESTLPPLSASNSFAGRKEEEEEEEERKYKLRLDLPPYH